MTHPFARTWWIDKGMILGGRYPGTPDPEESRKMLSDLVASGVRVIINLQEPGEKGRDGKPFPDYSGVLQSVAGAAGVSVELHRLPIHDWGVPTTEQMAKIQALLQASVDAGKIVYVHCWGGHGRTGTVGACWLIDHHHTVAEALAAMKQARSHDDHLAGESAPQSEPQKRFVQKWAERHAGSSA